MKSLKLLNKKYLLVFLFSIFFGSTTYSQEPVDIWSIEEKKIIEESSAIKNSEEQKAQQNSVYEMQSQKNNELDIKEDETLISKEIKDYVDRKSAFSVPNGTIAIYLSILASGIKKGSRVAVPNLTMIATINAVLWAESIPVLVDVDETLCMSYEKLTEVNDLDAVIFVPLNGRTGEGEKIEQWCEKNNILLIEDSAHALSSSYSNKKCGSLGDLSIFSFTPHKIVTMGQGGMILTNNKEYAENIFNLKTFNRSKDKLDWHDGFGLNFKITDLQSSLGLSQLSKLEKFIKLKKELHKQYLNNINDKYLKSFNEYETPWFID